MIKQKKGFLRMNIDHWPSYIFPFISEHDALALQIPFTLGIGEWLWRYSDTPEQFYIFIALTCVYTLLLLIVAIRHTKEKIFTKISMVFIYGIVLSIVSIAILKEAGGFVKPESLRDYYSWYVLILQVYLIIRSNLLIVIALWMIGSHLNGKPQELMMLEKRISNIQISRIQLCVMIILSIGLYMYDRIIVEPPHSIGFSIAQAYFVTSLFIPLLKR